MREPNQETGATERGLFILRLSLGLFFFVWALEKVVRPETANRIAGYFYGFELPAEVLIAVGILQLLLVVAFTLGAYRTLTYGTVAFYHACSTLSTWPMLIDPFGAKPDGIPHHLFLAAVPVLGGVLALFFMRKQDTLFRSPFA